MNDHLFFPIVGFVLILIYNIVTHLNRPFREFLVDTFCAFSAWIILWLILLVPGDPIG